MKLEPVTVSVNAALPTVAELGFNDATEGAGYFGAGHSLSHRRLSSMPGRRKTGRLARRDDSKLTAASAARQLPRKRTMEGVPCHCSSPSRLGAEKFNDVHLIQLLGRPGHRRKGLC